jgi:hypothetical protein
VRSEVRWCVVPIFVPLVVCVDGVVVLVRKTGLGRDDVIIYIH